MVYTVSVPRFTPTRFKSDPGLKIIALGDSIVYGFGDPVGGGWVERLRRQWMHADSPGHVIYNLGIRGNGVTQVLQRLHYEFSQRGELRNRYPDLIILSVGINDSARLGRPDGKLFTDLSLFQQQMHKLLEEAQDLCTVLFVGMTPVNEQKMPFLDCFYYNHSDQYNYKEITKHLCQELEIPYLDIFDLWMRRGELWRHSCLTVDGLHPNSKGYEELLEDVTNWDALRKLEI